MNPATLCRLKKEARALLPFWAAIAGLMVVPVMIYHNRDGGSELPLAVYVFGCALFGPVCIGHEFHYGTMGLLLSQPVSRRRLWWEKMTVLAAGLLGWSVWLVLLSLISSHSWRSFDFSIEHAPEMFAVLALPALVGFCTGPALTLLARGTLGGLALTWVGPWLLLLLDLLLAPSDVAWQSGQFTTREEIAVFFCLFAAPCLYLGGLVLLGCWRFQRLEDTPAMHKVVSLPEWLFRPFNSITSQMAPGRCGATWNLIHKELRLQQPAFVVALGGVAIWLVLLVLAGAGVPHVKEFLIAPCVMLSMIVPVIAGVVSTAEERSLGVHEWHLTLPVSAARQWFVKLLATLAVNAVLGLLLPAILVIVGGATNESRRIDGLLGGGFIAFAIANAVIFCAALYASTASSNSQRALIGSIVLFLAGAMVLNFADYIVDWVRLSPYLNMTAREQLNMFPSFLEPIHRHRWLLGWVGLAVWLYWLALGNYRRSLESLWRPLSRIALFFTVVVAFVFAAIVW